MSGISYRCGLVSLVIGHLNSFVVNSSCWEFVDAMIESVLNGKGPVKCQIFVFTACLLAAMEAGFLQSRGDKARIGLLSVHVIMAPLSLASRVMIVLLLAVPS